MFEKEKLENLLRSRSLKVTSKRLELLTLIANYGSAIPYSKIQKSLKNYDRVTLYRTLKALSDGCIIHKATVSTEDVYYAMCKEYCASGSHHHKHIHFKCRECLQVSCVDVLESLDFEIPGALVDKIQIEATGVCKKCM